MIKIFAVGHRKIIDFPALAKNDKQLSFLQKSGAYFSPLKVFAIRSTFWGPRDCRNSTQKVELAKQPKGSRKVEASAKTFWEWVLGIWKKIGFRNY